MKNVTFAPRMCGEITNGIMDAYRSMRFPYIYGGCIFWLFILTIYYAIYLMLWAIWMGLMAAVWFAQLHVWTITAIGYLLYGIGLGVYSIIRAIYRHHLKRRAERRALIAENEDDPRPERWRGSG